MSVYERFLQLQLDSKKDTMVQCIDATHGTVYENVNDMPIWFAEQPTAYAYFRFVKEC